MVNIKVEMENPTWVRYTVLKVFNEDCVMGDTVCLEFDVNIKEFPSWLHSVCVVIERDLNDFGALCKLRTKRSRRYPWMFYITWLN